MNACVQVKMSSHAPVKVWSVTRTSPEVTVVTMTWVTVNLHRHQWQMTKPADVCLHSSSFLELWNYRVCKILKAADFIELLTFLMTVEASVQKSE